MVGVPEMINVKSGFAHYNYSGSVTENNETRYVRETNELSIWEAMRVLVTMETFICFPRQAGIDLDIYEKNVQWKSMLSVHQAMFHLIGDGEAAYLKALKESIGLK
jgi:hypothetical protein